MKAKRYLGQIERYDRIINNKLVELAQWRSLATSISAQNDSERVQTSPKDKLSTVVSKIVDLEREIDKSVDEYIEKKQEIISTIERVEKTEEYDLLFKVYVEYKDLYELPSEMNFSYSYIKRLHGEALKTVDRILLSTK